VRVTDDGDPPATATQPFTVTVSEVNQPPQLAPISNVALLAGRTLSITNSASDPDMPPQTLTFQLLTAPSGMTLDSASGILAWRPRIDQAGSTNVVMIRVADNGTPSLANTQAFSATVLTPARPLLSSPSISNGYFSFQVSGDAGPDYVIERSFAETPWNWLPVFTNRSPALPFTWSTPANHSNSLFRVRLGPVGYDGDLVGPAILDFGVTTGVMTIRFQGGELESAPSVTGPWTGTGNTSGLFTQLISAAPQALFRVHEP
jgi:hypothetical protein